MSLPPEVVDELRRELERQQERIRRSLSLGAESVQTVQLDQQAVGRLSRMDSLQNQHLSRDLKERQEAQLGAIRTALRRVEDGTYGTCARCGGDVEVGRLFVVPEAEDCGSCG